MGPDVFCSLCFADLIDVTLPDEEINSKLKTTKSIEHLHTPKIFWFESNWYSESLHTLSTAPPYISHPSQYILAELNFLYPINSLVASILS